MFDFILSFLLASSPSLQVFTVSDYQDIKRVCIDPDPFDNVPVQVSKEYFDSVLNQKGALVSSDRLLDHYVWVDRDGRSVSASFYRSNGWLSIWKASGF